VTSTTTAPRTTVTHWETTLFSTGPALPAAPRVDRVSARAAFQEVLYGRAVLVDIRPAVERAAEGEVAASLAPVVVERDVLEGSFDPRLGVWLPQFRSEARVILLCQEGRASSLAVEALARSGARRAADVVGGFAAWRAAGLPVSAGATG
jgi:rhodanese-related sulfurtransferase